MNYLAIPRSTDRVDHLRDSKRALRRAQPYAIANVERELDADHHNCVKHRRRLS